LLGAFGDHDRVGLHGEQLAHLARRQYAPVQVEHGPFGREPLHEAVGVVPLAAHDRQRAAHHDPHDVGLDVLPSQYQRRTR
jgi:hypothetical protein